MSVLHSSITSTLKSLYVHILYSVNLKVSEVQIPDVNDTALLTNILCLSYTATDPSQSWMVHHSNALALSAALREAPEKIIGESRADAILANALKNSVNDRVCWSLWFFLVVE